MARLFRMHSVKFMREVEIMIGNKYELKRNEKELLEIEKDLAKYLSVPFVKCSYDCVNSHKYKDKQEVDHRKQEAKETGFWDMCDFVINYEKYETKEDYETNDGGYDGEVYELLYLKGNGPYIVITGCSE
jgi:hypothetical protein